MAWAGGAAAVAAVVAASRHCSYCGNQLDAFARYCNECGHEIPRPSRLIVVLVAALFAITVIITLFTILFIFV